MRVRVHVVCGGAGRGQVNVWCAKPERKRGRSRRAGRCEHARRGGVCSPPPSLLTWMRYW